MAKYLDKRLQDLITRKRVLLLVKEKLTNQSQMINQKKVLFLNNQINGFKKFNINLTKGFANTIKIGS